ncbi:hypothetical protein B9Z19DRAFT_1095686 [Tuber borchii]|uniref:Uncharacterized protein n=1 Tax=Tuber borchii TaxID=42251 RepID=A0A2T6ZCE0_TUBBO|nr:hypothetical protein B9Z19DRAFT_1095686 [Tuber borchii]
MPFLPRLITLPHSRRKAAHSTGLSVPTNPRRLTIDPPFTQSTYHPVTADQRTRTCTRVPVNSSSPPFTKTLHRATEPPRSAVPSEIAVGDPSVGC